MSTLNRYFGLGAYLHTLDGKSNVESPSITAVAYIDVFAFSDDTSYEKIYSSRNEFTVSCVAKDQMNQNGFCEFKNLILDVLLFIIFMFYIAQYSCFNLQNSCKF